MKLFAWDLVNSFCFELLEKNPECVMQQMREREREREI